MTPNPPTLLDLRDRIAALKAKCDADPLAGIDWLPGQHAFLSSTKGKVLFRAGNQLMGKSWALCAELIYRCTGTHPFKPTAPPPIRAWLICASWSQSLAIQTKLNALMPAGALTERCVFDPKNGYGRNAPVVEFANGSLLMIKTTGQKTLNLASDTVHVAAFDEPPPSPRAYTEVLKRLTRTNGDLLISMTPINAPCEWIRELAEAGQIEDIHYRATPENLIPVGRDEPYRLPDGTVADADWLEERINETLPYERGVVIHGEWETRIADRIFEAFASSGDDSHVVRREPDWCEDGYWTIGIDHGSGIGANQTAVLCCVLPLPEGRYNVYIADEYSSTDRSVPEDDLEGMLAMLRRNGLRWGDLKEVYGDQAVLNMKSSRRNPVRYKSNRDLEYAYKAKFGVWPKPRVHKSKAGKGNMRGSIELGTRFLHRQMLRPEGFAVHRRCSKLIESLDKWDYSRASKYKHIIDALRYALKRPIFDTPSKPRVINAVKAW